MSDRLEQYLRNSTGFRTYRFALSDLTTTTNSVGSESTGIAFEIFGIANSEVKLRHVQISKPSIALEPFQINKYSIASSTSASTAITRISPVPFRGTNSSYAGEVRFYTALVSPSTGTLVDQLLETDLATGDVMNEAFGDRGGISAPMLQGSTESFGFVIAASGGTVLNGYVELTAEP